MGAASSSAAWCRTSTRLCRCYVRVIYDFDVDIWMSKLDGTLWDASRSPPERQSSRGVSRFAISRPRAPGFAPGQRSSHESQLARGTQLERRQGFPPSRRLDCELQALYRIADPPPRLDLPEEHIKDARFARQTYAHSQHRISKSRNLNSKSRNQNSKSRIKSSKSRNKNSKSRNQS